MMPTLNPQASANLPTYSLTDWQGGTRSLPDEYDYWIDEVTGEIPPGLVGTLFRNGPGLLDIGGVALKHPFDGDGMICAFTFKDGQVHFRNRYVQTTGYQAEQQAGKILYRGVFGTPKPGGWLNNLFDMKLKNIANTQVIYWGAKLLALWEAAWPYQLNPATLETLGEINLDGLLKPGDAFAAHPRLDPQQQRLVNFSLKPGLTTAVRLFEFALDGRCVLEQDYNFPGFAFIHDFALTPNYGIFFQNPVQLNPIPYLLGFKGAAECLSFNPQHPTHIWLLPRLGGTPLHFTMPACFVFHHANAFELGDDIVVDSICYESFPGLDSDTNYRQVDFASLPPGQLWRIRINKTSQAVTMNQLDPRCCEFPCLHPNYVGQPYRYLYTAAADNPTGNAPLQGILRLDLETQTQEFWSAAPRGFVTEPVFVPDPTRINPEDSASQETAGWLLVLTYEASRQKSDLVILDAANVSQGPLARLHLKHHIPYGLHGTFTPQTFMDSPV
ncbi:carotenoid oxygenase family protein [Thermosynechococcaceae cyanobacterium BACA0444]|uniref:Carotenoid oxygenase family protein n=1 Tax=Pseudocalidococcus azoricus BACA0444 TaxID=2918990 RepID=A0AAE4FQX6_9CYAN|nr:carotenoid oxygenase family protein [Pseudocalidococcus azoricus]MDS3860613.1 carotenoid oxygenase family protein [Pseudocalidococcus azoricus BACA0444]